MEQLSLRRLQRDVQGFYNEIKAVEEFSRSVIAYVVHHLCKLLDADSRTYPTYSQRASFKVVLAVLAPQHVLSGIYSLVLFRTALDRISRVSFHSNNFVNGCLCALVTAVGFLRACRRGTRFHDNLDDRAMTTAF